MAEVVSTQLSAGGSVGVIGHCSHYSLMLDGQSPLHGDSSVSLGPAHTVVPFTLKLRAMWTGFSASVLGSRSHCSFMLDKTTPFIEFPCSL